MLTGAHLCLGVRLLEVSHWWVLGGTSGEIRKGVCTPFFVPSLQKGDKAVKLNRGGDMEKWKRILLALLAFLVTHFAAYFIFTVSYGPDYNIPSGFIALIDSCVALTVYYRTK